MHPNIFVSLMTHLRLLHIPAILFLLGHPIQNAVAGTTEHIVALHYVCDAGETPASETLCTQFPERLSEAFNHQDVRVKTGDSHDLTAELEILAESPNRIEVRLNWRLGDQEALGEPLGTITSGPSLNTSKLIRFLDVLIANSPSPF